MHSFGQYLYQGSPIHDLDPRTKIITVMALSIVILMVNPIGLLAAFALVIGVSGLARIPLGKFLQSLRPVRVFFLGLFMVYVLFTPVHALPGVSWGPLQIGVEGLQMGLVQVGKFLLLILAAAVLTMTTTHSEITMGVERLLRPLRIIGVSSHNVATMVSLALRFIPQLGEEMRDIRDAQLARGADFNPRRISGKIRSISYLAAPLALNVLRRGDELVDAMEARGYRPGCSRTYLREYFLTSRDYWVIGITLIIMAAIIVSGIYL